MTREQKVAFLKAWMHGERPCPVMVLFIEDDAVKMPNGEIVSVDEAYEWAFKYTTPPKMIEFVSDPRDAPLS